MVDKLQNGIAESDSQVASCNLQDTASEFDILELSCKLEESPRAFEKNQLLGSRTFEVDLFFDIAAAPDTS